jgi:hypothetical protein
MQAYRPTNGGVEREFAKSRLPSGQKTWKVYLEAYIFAQNSAKSIVFAAF